MNWTTREQKPYVPADADLPELTWKALLLGLGMAVVLGAANAYLGMKAGMTISATIPAAVIAIAAFRLPFFRGNVLEQNIARTTASVGEALVAGAIFTIPAFVLVQVGGQKLWTGFQYWQTVFILLVGGLLGVLFVILLRRTLCIDTPLPFPESYACAEIVKAGQKGESGARYVFGALGIGVLLQVLKDSQGFQVFRESVEGFYQFRGSTIRHFNTAREPLGSVQHFGGIPYATPAASPALMGIGYIIGLRLSAINFSGGVFAWGILIPVALFLDPDLPARLSTGSETPAWGEIGYSVWSNIVRPIAIGAMLVGSIYTLLGLRSSIGSALRGAFRSRRETPGGPGKGEGPPSRIDQDLSTKWILLSAMALVLPSTAIYYYFSGNLWGAVVAAVLMTVTGFLFSAVGGYLVGLVGGSNQPVSGLTLSTLVISALVILMVGVSGLSGVATVLAVAAVVCCAICTSGDMIQDLKAGYLLGGTPWKMEIAELISTVVVSFVLVFPIIILHQGNILRGGIGIGDKELPAPQAGLMAQLAVGIVGGEMPWGLIGMGMLFSLGLILIQAPSPMLIAIGMYLPLETTFAIFIGGLMKSAHDRILDWKGKDSGFRQEAEKRGILIASGFIAGEAITGIFLAVLIVSGIESLTSMFTGAPELPILESWGGWASLVIFAVVAYGLIRVPLSGSGRNGSAPAFGEGRTPGRSD